TNQDVSYTHTSPAFNQTNYYKAEISSPFESSPIVRIYLTDQPKPRMMTYPDPVVNQADILGIKIYNTSNIHVKGFLFNQFGKSLRDYDLTTNGDITSINVYDLSNGLYVLWLTDGNQVFSSKFVINR
ncbi:MAG: T9SS type A sorting domain-containing protein, partial [Bacteroidia bacterium]